MNFKSSKGVTLIALTITIVVILIISGTVIYNTNSHIRIDKVNKLYNDIEKINSKIDDYYLKYGEIPTIGEVYCDKNSLLSTLQKNSFDNNSALMSNDNIYINPNDGNDYFIIDLEKLDLGTLNYGVEGYTNVKKGGSDVKDVYIINKSTHQVYYPSGIFVKDYMYYAYNLDTNEL